MGLQRIVVLRSIRTSVHMVALHRFLKRRSRHVGGFSARSRMKLSMTEFRVPWARRYGPRSHRLAGVDKNRTLCRLQHIRRDASQPHAPNRTKTPATHGDKGLRFLAFARRL